ncbi:hypothetical protein [Kribbella lupini]|uniref:SdpI/YhfL family protein n=1 Tax=Kribbella lupini TaxID=291602 RepID=A0ABN2BP07_9ACTN
MEKYGPFANIAAVALALVALFSMLLLKSIGSVKKWTWLTDSSPSFLVTAGPRVLAIALMATAYLTAKKSNQTWFLAVTIVCGVLCLVAIAYFDRQRRVHVLGIPLVGADGAQLTDADGTPRTRNVVIGTETDLVPAAKRALKAARAAGGGISLARFMSGYGNPVNDPEALWDRGLLARIGSRLTLTLTGIVLFAVLTLFLAALLIDVAQR